MANRDKSITMEESFKPHEPDLYKAYVIMLGYIPSDNPDEILFA